MISIWWVEMAVPIFIIDYFVGHSVTINQAIKSIDNWVDGYFGHK